MTGFFRGARSLAWLVSACVIFASTGYASKESIVLAFNRTDGMVPLSSFVKDKAGNLYRVTSIGGNGNCADYGGGQGCGIVYELTPPAKSGGAWTETVLYEFQGGADGEEVVASLIFDSAGNLYGVTESGGGGSCTNGCGTVFRLSPAAVKGQPWTKSILYNFQGGTKDGSYPQGSLVFDREGNLYGTTFYGASLNCAGYGCGTAYELSPAKNGDGWTETVLHVFEGNNNGDGSGPGYNLIFDSAGNLYSAAGYGGAYGNGAVFELSPPTASGGNWTEKVIYSFIGTSDGSSPSGGLIWGANGVLYGVASGAGPAGYGSVYELTPPAQSGQAWTITVLFSFDLQADGGVPNGALVLDKKGNLYGTTAVGGDYSCNEGFNDGCGVVYQVKPPATQSGFWTETVLHAFKGGSDGMEPYTGLILGKFDLLYGTAEIGGASGGGVVFSVGK